MNQKKYNQAEKIKNYANWIIDDPLNKRNVLFALSALANEVVIVPNDLKQIISLVDSEKVLYFLKEVKEKDFINNLKRYNYILEAEKEKEEDHIKIEEILRNVKYELDKYFKKRGK